MCRYRYGRMINLWPCKDDSSTHEQYMFLAQSPQSIAFLLAHEVQKMTSDVTHFSYTVYISIRRAGLRKLQ
jgi:hypothetical protein